MQNLPTFFFFHYIPSLEELKEIAETTPLRICIYIDDFSLEAFSNDLVYQLFCKMSTHNGIDAVVSVHSASNGKNQGKWYQAVFEKCNFLVLFRSLSNRSSVGEQSKKIFPYCNNFLQRVLNKVSEICGNYSYIVVDGNLANGMNNRCSVKSNIFCENGLPVLYFKNPSLFYSGK